MKIKLKKLSISSVKQLLTANKKYSLASAVIIILMFFIILQNCEILDKFVVTEEDVAAKLQSASKLQMKLNKTEIEFRRAESEKEIFLREQKKFWVKGRDGDVNINMPKIIEEAAKKSNVELKNLGTIRIISKGNEINNGEFDIGCFGTMEQIMKFISIVNCAEPQIYWVKCILRPENTKDSKKIHLTGYLAFIIIENEDIINLMHGNKAK